MADPLPPSPFAPNSYPDMPPIPGIQLATTKAGIKYKDREDLLLVTFDEGTVVAGVLTQSKTRSAPVEWCAKNLKQGHARALVVNSGNANAFTGMRGHEAVTTTAKAITDAIECQTVETYIASTGVIGEPLDTTQFAELIAKLAQDVAPDNWPAAAHAIMTTDTFPKLATTQIQIDGTPVTISGIAKGAGMIAPDMATTLCFVFTDAAISKPLLQDCIADTTAKTFNCITVDGDTSTSDTLLVFATGQAVATGAKPIKSKTDPAFDLFAKALHAVVHDLALQVVKDGEGISKFVTINITGAENDTAAQKIGMSVANSPLVKTALAGEDPNWGRIVMAVGKAGERADRDRLRISFGPHLVAIEGERAADYKEETGATYMKNAELEISIDVGVGDGQATVWTCDLTHGYISINADYRT